MCRKNLYPIERFRHLHRNGHDNATHEVYYIRNVMDYLCREDTVTMVNNVGGIYQGIPGQFSSSNLKYSLKQLGGLTLTI
jgi:hypothetical protein